MIKPDRHFLQRLRQLAPNVSEFARQLGMPQPMVHSYVAGSRSPGYEFFYRLAHKKIDVLWLLTGQKTAEHEVNHMLVELSNSETKDILEVVQLLASQKRRKKWRRVNRK